MKYKIGDEVILTKNATHASLKLEKSGGVPMAVGGCKAKILNASRGLVKVKIWWKNKLIDHELWFRTDEIERVL